MKKCRILVLIALLTLCASLSRANVNCNGNGNTSFGGAVGTGVLSLSDDGTNVYGTFTLGSGTFNDCLVIYIQAGASSGISSTAGFNDTGDGSRKAISGFNGTTNSVLTFAPGFSPNYAIALGPTDNNFGGLWFLVNGGTFPFVDTVNLSPLNNSGPVYAFSFPASDIGLTPGVSGSFKLFGTYISNTGYRSGEAVAGNLTGTPGWQPFTQTSFTNYNFASGVRVTYPVTFQVDMSVQITNGTFNPFEGDVVEARGTFQSPIQWTGGFILTNNPSSIHPNIYSGTYQDGSPTGTPEQVKFAIAPFGDDTSAVFESSDNRPFTLQAGNQTLPLVYYSDLTPSSAVPTSPITFRVDMSAQIRAGLFNPQNGDTVEVQGTFQTPTQWVDFYTLTNNPSSVNPNLYSGTFSDANYPGTWEQYKFVILNGGPTVYETINNRDFTTPASAQVFPSVYFNNGSNTVVFQVDMSVEIQDGNFNSLSPQFDYVEARGTFNGWSAGFLLTNNPSSASSNIYSGIAVVGDPIGAVEQYKFVVDGGTGLGWEQPVSTAGGNRLFTLTSTNQTLPAVLFSDLAASDLLSTDTWVTFSVNMTNAVGTDATVFNPATHSVYINGDFLGWWTWGTQPVAIPI